MGIGYKDFLLISEKKSNFSYKIFTEVMAKNMLGIFLI